MAGSSPCRWRRWIHWQSRRSVFGRPWIWRVNLADVTTTWKPASRRRRNRTWPYTPVASRATVVTPQNLSQATRRSRPGVWAGNSRIVSELSGASSTHTQWVRSPTSMPAAWRLATGRDVSRATSSAWRRNWASRRAARWAAFGDSGGSVRAVVTVGLRGGGRTRHGPDGGVGRGTSRPNGIGRAGSAGGAVTKRVVRKRPSAQSPQRVEPGDRLVAPAT